MVIARPGRPPTKPGGGHQAQTSHGREADQLAKRVGLAPAGHVLLVRRRIPEGSLVWQLPAGKIQPGESAEQAAVRETREETGLIVAALRALGQRAHPATGRTMVYVACDVLAGTAHAASPVEVAALVWAGAGELARLVPDGFYEPVQRHLDEAMAL